MEITDILKLTPFIPVITFTKLGHVLPVAQALMEGNVHVIEVALRSPIAIDAIRMINNAMPEMLVGAGTLIHDHQFAQAKEAGARFLVSPGLTPNLASKAKETGLSYLPGAITPSEVIHAIEMGFSTLKFFPAESTGGVATLKHFAAVFPTVQFCPTGGINKTNAQEYLALPNVIAVGGSLIPQNLIEKGDWETIAQLARSLTSH